MNFLIESTAHRTVVPGNSAKRFSEIAAKFLCDRLPEGKRAFRLTPYRVRHSEYLGFDWRDEGGNYIVFTFVIGEQNPLPSAVYDVNEVWVGDATDALLLVRLIAEAVTGSSVGTV